MKIVPGKPTYISRQSKMFPEAGFPAVAVFPQPMSVPEGGFGCYTEGRLGCRQRLLKRSLVGRGRRHH